MKTMTIDMADTFAPFASKSGRIVRKRWPAISCNSKNWAITVPDQGWGSALAPRDEFNFVVITHRHTGLKARTARSIRTAKSVIKKFDVIFGNSRTKEAIMRKYNKLSNREKNYARGYL